MFVVGHQQEVRCGMPHYLIRRRATKGRGLIWNVTTDEGIYGDYLSEDSALLDAIDAAQEAGEAGHPAQVLTHGIDGIESVRWTYGDPYPYPYRLHG
jgi:hypothetical protein